MDLDRLERKIDQRLAPFALGHGWSIAQDGQALRSGANGMRRIPGSAKGMANPLPYTEHTLIEVASTSKTVTLIAVVKALRACGITVDSPVSPHLPPAWVRGPGMSTVTLRPLLSHGMKPVPSAGLFKPGNCGSQPYDCLRTAVAAGLIEAPSYDNIHCTLFRVILPMVRDPVGGTVLCANQADDALANQCFSSEFRRHIRNLLAEYGVDADFAYDMRLL